MKRRIVYWKASINSKMRLWSKGKIGVPKSYYGKRILSAEQGNEYIYQKLLTNEPFCVARLGSVELNALVQFEEPKYSSQSKREEAMRMLCNNAGFFPNNVEKGYEFTELYMESLKHIDAIAVWYNPLEDYFIHKYGRDTKCMQLRALEPYFYSVPWSKALKNKRVLVIHPFAKSIMDQYEKKAKLFSNQEVLPDFKLVAMQAVQTSAGQKDERFGTWFDALEYMYQETKKIDFDVAIIGCGAYGLPLATMLKCDGKQAIHMGGATQILFGIRGKRWDERSEFVSIFNDEWIYPSNLERPKNASNVENACYW